MIIVMGATGATGGALLRALADLGLPSRALSRAPRGLRAGLDPAAAALVEVREADAGDPASLLAAFAGGSQLFLTMANGPRQVEFELRVIEAALECGIEHIVKISSPAAEPDSPVAVARGHHTVEAYLRTAGVQATVLRPYAFMQNLLLLAPGVARGGVVAAALGDAPCNYIDCRDIGEVAAAVLARPELVGGTYTLTGAEAVGHGRLAELLTGLLGRPVRHLELAPEQLRAQLIEQGRLPGWLADHVVEIQRLAVARPERPTDAVARLLGRAPRGLEAFLVEHLDLFR
ncbi:NmrA family NAD(P)-binding protein [Kitasatospora sp. NBC_01287]|uniref:NmrA family NAD(P)-binding protein n=1 Tax=Kitasatospora sp. NBC_01287 TaxID=2903573 RepID=UPI0022529491|nr:NmrA family NAD(P)-binding protein [Kitasatospora sp. NBC_01287]MCX4744470.1 NmrA family NAD(P)-binding protein [Kitasatospora sp. NBC_01287]